MNDLPPPPIYKPRVTGEGEVARVLRIFNELMAGLNDEWENSLPSDDERNQWNDGALTRILAVAERIAARTQP